MLPVAVDVCALQVVQKTAALANHLEETAAAMVVLLVHAEMISQVVDALREQRDLNASEPVSVSCTRYFSTVGAFSKAMS